MARTAMTSGAVALSTAAKGQTPPPQTASPDQTPPFDVVVVGGGPAGLCAANQAARTGARTLLIEKNGMLGGTTTSAGVNFPGLFHAWGKQIIAGNGWQLVTRCVEESSKSLPDFSQSPKRHWHHQVRVDRAVYAALADEFLTEAGVALSLHTMVARVECAPDGVRLDLCTKTGLMSVQTRMLVDCTGDANATGLAGFELIAHEEHQPGTLMLGLSGYDMDDLDLEAIKAAAGLAIQEKRLLPEDMASSGNNIIHFLSARGDNCMHVVGVDGRTSAGRTQAELAGRSAFLRLYRFLRGQPGLENLRVDFMAPECGIRETVTIRGESTITAKDYVSGRFWDDAVCYSFYPIDLHRANGAGIEQEYLKEGALPTVPRTALLPQGSRNVLVAGRCLSSDRLANSALRVQATCMATGQAAGAWAALAAKQGGAANDVPLDALQNTLREHKAIVPSATKRT